MKQEYIFDLPKRWTFQYLTFNGAPQVKLDSNGGADINGKPDDSVKRFVLQDADREAASSDRWDMPYLTEPTVKVLVHFKGVVAGTIIKGDMADPKMRISTYVAFFSDYSDELVKKCLLGYDAGLPKKMPPARQVDVLYNMIKYQFLFMHLDLPTAGKVGRLVAMLEAAYKFSQLKVVLK